VLSRRKKLSLNISLISLRGRYTLRAKFVVYPLQCTRVLRSRKARENAADISMLQLKFLNFSNNI